MILIITFVIGTIVGGGVMAFIASANMQNEECDSYDYGYEQGRKDERSLRTRQP